MPQGTRVYVVKRKGFEGVSPENFTLVRAPNAVTARSHVADAMYDCWLASKDDLERLITAGLRVQSSVPKREPQLAAAA